MTQKYSNATIYDGTGKVYKNATLVVENGIIIEVGEDITEADDSIDCTGLFLTPGFVDAHTHTGIWEEGAGPGPGNNDGNELSDPITPYLRTIDSIHPEDIGFEDARRGGVTTLGVTHGSANPIGGQFCVVKSFGKEVDEMTIRQPAGLKLALGENPKRVGETRNRAPTSRMGVAHLIREAFYEAIDYQTEWQTYQEFLEIEEQKPKEEQKPVKKPKFDLGKDTLLKVLSGQIPVRCHGHRADDIRTAIRLSDEFGFQLIIDHGTESYKIKETIVSREIPLAIGPLIGGRSKRELLDMTQETPGIMVKAGALVAIMSDSPFTPVQHLRDSMIMAIREGLPQEEALQTITSNPAKLLGVENRVGSLEKGKDADFVIFDGDPFDARSRVVKTIIDGKAVFER